MMSEAEIISGCIKGDKKAQKALYDKYSAKMLGVCLRYFKSSDEAEDALQEGFIRVFNNIGKFRGDGSFDGWIRRIIVNTALNFYKSNLKHYYAADYDDIQETTADVKLSYDTLSVEYLLKVIQALPEGYKLIFNLYEIEGYSHKEIGQLLGISINTSKSQLMKSKTYIQKKLINKESVI
ncbi:MAG: sigma-70 family RNA polymerase sigma factor [Bacteroidetes bacterium]|nr:sigma-70 family RNA polymerase sigma factor [Bacteroidota bacterium]